MIQIFESKILETKNLTPSVKYLKLSIPKNFEFEAGQFIFLNCPPYPHLALENN